MLPMFWQLKMGSMFWHKSDSVERHISVYLLHVSTPSPPPLPGCVLWDLDNRVYDTEFSEMKHDSGVLHLKPNIMFIFCWLIDVLNFTCLHVNISHILLFNTSSVGKVLSYTHGRLQSVMFTHFDMNIYVMASG